MPELPEVETIKSQISPLLPLKIVEIKESIHANGLILEKQFEPQNKTINSIVRFGKTLQFNLTNNCHIVSGLGMTGNWRISDKPLSVPHKHLELSLIHISEPTRPY